MEIIRKDKSFAMISKKGAFVSYLKLINREIFKQTVDGYTTHGGMSTLIPYADLVKNASYKWLGTTYYLPKNAKYENNFNDSIHGLIRSSKFNINKKTDNSISLCYKLIHRGYPSSLLIKVIYTINSNSLSTEYIIKNVGEIEAPFMCGAHPYFIHNGNWKIVTGNDTRHIMGFDDGTPIIGSSKFGCFSNKDHKIYDDTYYSKNDIKIFIDDIEIGLKRINMPFFEIYNGTFAGENSVAIEPLSGIPNSFNHKYLIDTIPPKIEKKFSFVIDIKIKS